MRGALLLLAGILLTACGAERPSEPPPDPAAPALELARAGRYQEAAEQFLALADAHEAAQRARFQLHAAANLLAAGRDADAETLLGRISPASADHAAWQRILLAQIALDRDRDPERALRALSELGQEELAPSRLGELLRLKIRALEALDRPLQVAGERARLEPLIDKPHLARENRRRLWDALKRVKPERLRDFDGDTPLAAWVDLAKLANSSLYDPQLFQRELETWSQRYPGHPASEEIVPELVDSSRALAVVPRQICGLLPFSGRYSSAAEAIRDGMIAAHYGLPVARRPSLRFYDANVANIGGVYDQAVADGCNTVIGPLERGAVDGLAAKAPLPVLTVALNRMSRERFTKDMATDLNFYQFGFSPEDEARQAAERAWFDGHQSTLILFPEGEWGERVGGSFRERWQALGGAILEEQVYVTATRHFIDPVKHLLNIDGSERRIEELRQHLGRRIHALPRRRQDADFIFLAAYPVQARQIKPHLRFYRASQIPVYSTSHVFTGRADSEADHDMDGITFGDIPLVFDRSGQRYALAAYGKRFWPNRDGGLIRLFALGADAYGVLPHLGRMRIQSGVRVEGTTGTLSLDRQGRITRRLTWAIFEDGRPRLRETVDES